MILTIVVTAFIFFALYAFYSIIGAFVFPIAYCVDNETISIDDVEFSHYISTK